VKPLLADKQAFATPLLLYAVDTVGEDLFDLEPETVGQILRRENPKTPQRNINKVNAALGLLQSNLFWQDPITFGITCRTLNRAPRVDIAPPNLDDIMWGITEARLIVEDTDKNKEKFSDSIASYVALLLKMGGIVTTVPTLDFITPPRPTNQYDDPDQSLSVLTNSEDRVKDMESSVGIKMITLLKQIKDLNIDLSEQASKDLEELLEGR